MRSTSGFSFQYTCALPLDYYSSVCLLAYLYLPFLNIQKQAAQREGGDGQ